MKKIISKLMILLAGLALCGCQSGVEPSYSVPESEDVSNSSLQPIVVDDDTHYSTHFWDENIVKMIEYAVGDAVSLVPAYVAKDYAAYIERFEDTDIYGESYFGTSTRIVCSPVNKNVVDEYGLILENAGFIYSPEYDIFYNKASASDMIYVSPKMFEVKDYYTMNIEIYRKKIRESEWDPEVAYLILGQDIPYIQTEAYEYYFDAYSMTLECYFINVSDKQISDYRTELVKAGYQLKSTDSVYDIYASLDETIRITMYSGVDSFNDTYLCLILENAWPFYLVYASTFGNPVPKCDDGVYYGYDTYGDEKSGYYTQIEFDYVEYNDFMGYCQILESMDYGYKLIPDDNNPSSYVSETPGFGTIYTRSYYKQASDEEIAYVDVMYSSGLARLIIVVYA